MAHTGLSFLDEPMKQAGKICLFLVFFVSLVPAATAPLDDGVPWELELSYFRAPEFPAAARLALQSGDVELRITVKEGRVSQIVVERSPSEWLSESAKEAVSKWNFHMIRRSPENAQREWGKQAIAKWTRSKDQSVWIAKVVLHYRFSERQSWNCRWNTVVEMEMPQLEVTITTDPPEDRPKPPFQSSPKPRPTVPLLNSAPPRESVVVGGTEVKRILVPRYPPLARQLLITGNARVVARIEADGNITGLFVDAVHPLLIDSLHQTVAQWQFYPPGTPRTQTILFHFGFGPERRDCGYRTATAADWPWRWTITADSPDPNPGTPAPLNPPR